MEMASLDFDLGALKSYTQVFYCTLNAKTQYHAFILKQAPFASFLRAKDFICESRLCCWCNIDLIIMQHNPKAVKFCF